MTKPEIKKLEPKESQAILEKLKIRFNKNMNRHEGFGWEEVERKLRSSPEKLWSLAQMEETGGEPDLIGYYSNAQKLVFFDCSPESPKGRRSLCYDKEALESRKEFKPENNVMDMASQLGIEILTEEEYRHLQTLGNFDTKTSSWLSTPSDIRKLGGSIFGDYRYGKVFIYHNGASSYYASRGFRASLEL